MKPNRLDRRVFVSTTAKAGFALCGVCLCSPFAAVVGEETESEKKVTLEGRTFCGYKCPDDCKFLQGTLKDDIEIKREAWALWKIEERFGVAFDPEQAICYGCKETDKPKGIVLSRCTVRDCAIERGEECCIDCDDLVTCEKDLWNRFPDFKKQVIEAQKKYRQQT